MLDIIEQPHGYSVKFQYKPWIVEAIKKIPGARFNGEGKHWDIPASSGTALLNWAKNLQASFSKSNAVAAIGPIDPLPELEIDIPLKRPLFPYQATGVAYALKKQRVIVGDQPGLGKTGQAIATLHGAGAKCILVICPATIRENWRREWEIWTGRKALILSDRVKLSWPQYYKVGMVNVFICNYESLKKYFVQAINKPAESPLRLNHIVFRDSIKLFDAVIVDEIHRCKDGKTQTAKFCMGIAKGKQWVLGLTGTPVVNKPIDLIPQLHIIDQLGCFGGYKGFVNRFCQGSTGASNLKELNYLMHKNCFYRREKTEVLKDLPAKIRSIRKTTIDNAEEYRKAEEKFVDYLRDNLNKSDGEINTALRGEAMVQLSILKKIAAHGKIAEVVEYIEEVVDSGEKIVVFAWHKDIVRKLKDAIPGALTIVGDDSMDQRNAAVDAFQNDPKRKVILLNIKSGGVGITLTASSRVAFIELPWHPADCEQGEDRCHRIGQHDSVQCTYFLGHGTIDEYIYGIIERKRAIVDQITGAESQVETNMVDELISLLTSRK